MSHNDELRALLPSLKTLELIDDDAMSGCRPCPLNNLTIADVRKLHAALSPPAAPSAVDEGITLDVAQIRQLVEFVQAMDPETEPDTLVVIAWRDNITGDDGKPEPASHVAWLADYPDEGCYPLSDADDPRTAEWVANHAALQSAAPVQGAVDDAADAALWRKHKNSFAVLTAMLDAASPLVLNKLKAQEAERDSTPQTGGPA